MHFLREGQFEVATAFLRDTDNADTLSPKNLISLQSGHQSDLTQSDTLRAQFSDMYHILNEMKNNRNLKPATAWASIHSSALEARGSNLEFELSKLQFISLSCSGREGSEREELVERQQKALSYARNEFSPFQDRYLRDIQQLITGMAFSPNLEHSPYKRLFYSEGAWEELASSFTREFCSLLGLSADSPIYIAATAGAIALPTLQKLRVIMEKKRTEWTTQSELPVSTSI